MGKLKSMGSRIGSLAARVQSLPKVAESIYVSPEWRALMGRIFAKRGRFCQDCGAGGKGVRLYGDHVIELKDGGEPFDEENVRIRCAPCHGRKTAGARKARALGQTG